MWSGKKFITNKQKIFEKKMKKERLKIENFFIIKKIETKNKRKKLFL